jgi:hypothetical protein
MLLTVLKFIHTCIQVWCFCSVCFKFIDCFQYSLFPIPEVLLISCLTLFRISPFNWSDNFSTLHQTMVCATLTFNNLDSYLAGVLAFSLILLKALLQSTSSSKFSDFNLIWLYNTDKLLPFLLQALFISTNSSKDQVTLYPMEWHSKFAMKYSHSLAVYKIFLLFLHF